MALHIEPSLSASGTLHLMVFKDGLFASVDNEVREVLANGGTWTMTCKNP